MTANGKDGASDACRELRKRLRLKNPKVQLLSLNLADQLVRNCGLDLHQQVASKDFMTDMQNLVSGMHAEVDMEVNRKALLLIQCWGESFKEYRDELPLYYEIYASLKSQGTILSSILDTDLLIEFACQVFAFQTTMRIQRSTLYWFVCRSDAFCLYLQIKPLRVQRPTRNISPATAGRSGTDADSD